MQRTQCSASPLLLQRRDGRRSPRTAAAAAVRDEREQCLNSTGSPCPRSPRHRTEHPQWPQLPIVTAQYVFVVVNVPSC